MTSERSDEQAKGPAVDEPGVEERADAGEPVEEAPEAGARPVEDEGQGGDEGPREEAAAGAGREIQALNDRYLRLAAEYDNYRKRTERERTESWGRAQAELVKKLLDGLDDLQRVADYSPENTSIEALLEGVQMVERKLLRALEGAGLEVIEASGQTFDPEQHEALMMTAAETPEEDNSVGEVFQKGYRFKGTLLRPARVQVRRHEG